VHGYLRHLLVRFQNQKENKEDDEKDSNVNEGLGRLNQAIHVPANHSQITDLKDEIQDIDKRISILKKQAINRFSKLYDSGSDKSEEEQRITSTIEQTQ
jgi:hypothetical protein